MSAEQVPNQGINPEVTNMQAVPAEEMQIGAERQKDVGAQVARIAGKLIERAGRLESPSELVDGQRLVKLDMDRYASTGHGVEGVSLSNLATAERGQDRHNFDITRVKNNTNKRTLGGVEDGDIELSSHEPKDLSRKNGVVRGFHESSVTANEKGKLRGTSTTGTERSYGGGPSGRDENVEAAVNVFRNVRNHIARLEKRERSQVGNHESSQRKAA